jgi:Type I phosphodiesterase / nucleotide pyrophosphatase
MAERPTRRRRRGRTSWLVAKLGLSRSDYPLERRGFIGIQIDGLGYYVLKGALNRRYTPFLRKLVKRKHYALHRVHIGLPATTPASQLAFFYGDNWDVPGFRWLDKDRRELRITKSAAVCAELEARARERSPRGGVLRHGSSYCNMFSGDAESSTLTLSTIAASRRGKLRWRDVIVFSALLFGLFLRVLVLSAWELLVELYDHLQAVHEGRRTRDEGVFPIVRAVTNVVFREIATQGCLLDIDRGVPFVYLNYSGYDEVAHHRGPNSIYAKLVLRGIDAQVKRIVRAAERAEREYDVVLLSDHGQSTTIPWEQLHGQSLTEFMLEQVASSRLHPLGADFRAKQVGRTLAFSVWLRELEWMLPRGLARVVQRAARWMADRLPDEAADIDWSSDAEILVAPTGSLAHVYFTHTDQALAMEDVAARHGGLLDALVAHPSIAVVASRTRAGGVEIRAARGALVLGPERERRLSGEHPLGKFIEGDELEGAIARLASMPHAGDLVLFSAREPHGRVVNFQVEMGSHGGLHLEEQSAFVIARRDLDFDFEAVKSARDMYPLFARYHEAGAAESAAAG